MDRTPATRARKSRVGNRVGREDELDYPGLTTMADCVELLVQRTA